MRLLLLLLCLTTLPSPAKTQMRPLENTGTIAGTVTDAATKLPVRLAGIRIFRLKPKPGAPNEDDSLPTYSSATTGLDGRYLFRHVPPGRYGYLCSAPGYISPEAVLQLASIKPLGRTQRETGPQFLVTPGKEVHLDLTIDRGAVITGQVAFDDGTPAGHVFVQVVGRPLPLSPDAPSDHPFLRHNAIESGPTDDRGRYRLAGLPPGEYLVEAMLNLSPGAVDMGDEAHDRAELKVFAPSVLSETKAQRVRVRGAEEVRDIDIRVSLDGLYQITGHLLAQTDGRPLNHATLKLTSQADPSFNRTVEVAQDGSYTLDYVPPGSYTLEISNVSETVEVKVKDKDGDDDTKTKVLHSFQPQTISVTVLKQDVLDFDQKFVEDKTRKPGLLDDSQDDKVGEST